MNINPEWIGFCQNMRALREEHGYSLREMAKILHISVKTLSLLESGTLPRRTSANIIFLLSRHFDIPPKELFTLR